MDTLTHGLLGVAVATLVRRPEARAGEPLTPTDRACLLAALAAAELPDLDYLLPAANDALHALKAHRGLSHALAFAPVVAAVATGLARLVFRRARTLPVFLCALAAVVLGHLLCDAWTGWGTRLFLPFSDARLALDWTMVVDPWFTVPLLVGAIVAIVRRRRRWRRALLVGLAVSVVYLGFRIGSREVLAARVRAAYPGAAVGVFPTILSPHRWRFVATGADFAAGTVSLGGAPREQARHPRALPELGALAADETVREALAWARYPVVTRDGDTLRIADLRYHLGGAPTLAFVLRLDANGHVVDAKLDRGRARDLVERWREDE